MGTLNLDNVSPDISIQKGFPVFDANIISIFKECTPKILVVTDGLGFTGTSFGLSDFVNTLKTSSIHGMTPIVETALHQASGVADLPNFFFTSLSLSKSKYDVLFLFGVNGPALDPKELSVIEDFMDAGGGVFATGDHSILGKALCGDIKRVKEMRRWNGPTASGSDRLSTNDPGTDNVYQFIDQSDAIPQKIYPAYDAITNLPHPLLQHPTKNIIEVLPDHAHESECLVPASVSGEDWPKDSDGDDVSPELVALSMSYGGGFTGKVPIDMPRSFGAIGAYNGHLTGAGVGRIVVDATWHHFININIIATGAGSGIVANPDAYDRINTYFRNIADWLMPKKVRRCLRWPIFIALRELYPVGEFLMENAGREIDLAGAIELGRETRASLKPFLTPAQISDIEDNLIELANPRLKYRLKKLAKAKKLNDVVAKDFATEDMYRLTASGTAIHTVAAVFSGEDDISLIFEKLGGEKGLEAKFQKKIDGCLKVLNEELSRGRAVLDELIEIAK